MSERTRKKWLLGSATPMFPVRFSTSSDARRDFPDILQDAFGLKSMTGIHRYGRALGAIIPIEAVRLLAGYPDAVDDETKVRIRNAALNLLEERDTLGLH